MSTTRTTTQHVQAAWASVENAHILSRAGRTDECLVMELRGDNAGDQRVSAAYDYPARVALSIVSTRDGRVEARGHGCRGSTGTNTA